MRQKYLGSDGTPKLSSTSERESRAAADRVKDARSRGAREMLEGSAGAVYACEDSEIACPALSGGPATDRQIRWSSRILKIPSKYPIFEPASRRVQPADGFSCDDG
jgi:hypothetical protein